MISAIQLAMLKQQAEQAVAFFPRSASVQVPASQMLELLDAVSESFDLHESLAQTRHELDMALNDIDDLEFRIREAALEKEVV